MNVRVDLTAQPPSVSLEEPENLRAFALRVRGDGDPAAIDAALGELGRVDADGGHAWLQAAGVRGLAGPLATDAGWARDFDAMIAYADSKGWMREDAIRAHIERDQEETP